MPITENGNIDLADMRSIKYLNRSLQRFLVH